MSYWISFDNIGFVLWFGGLMVIYAIVWWLLHKSLKMVKECNRQLREAIQEWREHDEKTKR